MTYDNWKATNPADESLGPDPEQSNDKGRPLRAAPRALRPQALPDRTWPSQTAPGQTKPSQPRLTIPNRASPGRAAPGLAMPADRHSDQQIEEQEEEASRSSTTVPSPANGGGEAFLAMIARAARDPSVDIDKLDRLLRTRERENARVAEQAFNAALAEAQAEMHPVAADSDNPQTRSRYASYAALDRAVRAICTRHGFGLTFNTADAPGPEQARIVCDVCHAGGHTRRYHVDVPVDGKGAKGGDVMTKTHATGSGISYGMRYLLRMIFNLAIDYDDDGNAAGGRATPERPRTVVPAPKHRLKAGGISERAIAARVAQAWEPKPPRIWTPSQAGHLDEPPPHVVIPDGPGETAARKLNRELYPLHDELPAHSAPPKQPAKVDGETGIPDFLDRRKGNGTGEASYIDLVGGDR